MAVFVLDKKKQPLMPCSEKRARLLLQRGRAVVVRLHPFTIRLKDRLGGKTQPLHLQLDPGSQTTGIALVRDNETLDPDTGEVHRAAHAVWLGELTHRGAQIRNRLASRRACRRRRRTQNLRHRIPKTHALDAACVSLLDALHGWNRPALAIKATGRGSYQRTRLNRFGFPRGYLMREKRVEGFQTGDQVVAQVPSGEKAGPHSGRVAVRASGSFNIQTAQGVVQGISHRYCRVVQRADGYNYSLQPTLTEEARRVA
ncbi:RRXRR domain-containing protein [Rhabdochromatium marinum]|uniref:RRXRR domain-containing protein n=1 Tax=Rhabdochromatium marinum TaxID=48729 RepID=UPI001907DAE4|nr:RRXRR domain-containing protein [Rhabdochromatium marinum]MBK1650072.1 hypothetical protein [Rhabdochromatium marinum]